MQVSDRYRLTGDILDGEMDLDILSVRRTDSGPYCCRVDIDGVFNDKKVIMNLRVVKGEQLEWTVSDSIITLTGWCLLKISQLSVLSSAVTKMENLENIEC